MVQGVCWVGLGASLQDDRIIVKARLAEMGPQLLEGPHWWVPSWSGCHPPRTYVAAGPVPRERPFREDLTVQSSPNVPGFLSTPSLTAMLLRTATNRSGTAVKKLKVLNLLSPRLMIRTAWELLPWRIFLSVSYFLLNHSTVVRMITAHRRVYTPQTMAVLFPSFTSTVMLWESLSFPSEEEPEGQRGCSPPKLYAASDLGGSCTPVCVCLT